MNERRHRPTFHWPALLGAAWRGLVEMLALWRARWTVGGAHRH